MNYRLAFHLAFVAVVVFLPAAQAQCPNDDGFNVGCCNTPVPNLPNFPPITSGATYACFQNCNLENQFTVMLALSAPQLVTCDLALINVNVTATGVVGPSFSGILVGKYARTWTETNSMGQTRQVWRFLLNGDMAFNPLSVGATACPIPPCSAPPNNLPVHMAGHVDYAIYCPASTVAGWEHGLSLTHMKGCLNHAFFSQRPLAGPAAHNDRSYVMISPPNFLFSAVSEPAGPLVAESVRSAALVNTPPFWQCFGEARVANFGSVNTSVNGYCYSCQPILPLSNLWKDQSINGGVSCGPLTVLFPFNTIPIPGIFPAGMISKSIGTWVGFNPNQYPIGKSLTINYGLMQYQDNCLADEIHVFTGIGTTGGDPATLFTQSPATAPMFEFLDLQNMKVFGPTGGLMPGIGALFVATHVWNLNTM